MKRTMFQLYLNNCDEAIPFYLNAFDASLNCIFRDETDNHVIHAEMDVFGQIVAFSENGGKAIAGNTMQLCFHFGEGNEEIIQKAYAMLKEDAVKIDCPPEPCMFSSCMTSLVDKYGVYWCLFV